MASNLAVSPSFIMQSKIDAYKSYSETFQDIYGCIYAAEVRVILTTAATQV